MAYYKKVAGTLVVFSSKRKSQPGDCSAFNGADMTTAQKSTSKAMPKVALLALPRGFYGTVQPRRPRSRASRASTRPGHTANQLEEGLASWNDYVDANPLPLASVRMF